MSPLYRAVACDTDYLLPFVRQHIVTQLPVRAVLRLVGADNRIIRRCERVFFTYKVFIIRADAVYLDGFNVLIFVQIVYIGIICIAYRSSFIIIFCDCFDKLTHAGTDKSFGRIGHLLALHYQLLHSSLAA